LRVCACYRDIGRRLPCSRPPFCATGKILANANSLPWKTIPARARGESEGTGNSSIEQFNAELGIRQLVRGNQGALRGFNG